MFRLPFVIASLFSLSTNIVMSQNATEPSPSPSATPSAPPTIGLDVPTLSATPSEEPSTSNGPTSSAYPTDNCPCPECTHSAGCNPDPHYYAWDNTYYDFQGGCDQIAIDNPVLQVQMRTRPRGYYSTITEVVVIMKSTGQMMRVSTTVPNSNSIDTTSNAQAISFGPGGYELNFLDSPASFIRVTKMYGGNHINLQVRGDGTIFCSSEGMLGSFNFGGVRFRNGALYDTTGGWSATRLTSIALARDWQVPLAENLLTNPSDVCDASSNCGPGEAFECSRRLDDEKRELQSSVCDKTCDDIGILDPTGIMQAACEEDLLLLDGNNFFTCQPAYVEPTIVAADPDDFDYSGSGACNDNPSEDVDAILLEEVERLNNGKGHDKGLGKGRGNGLRKRNPFLRGCARLKFFGLCDDESLKYQCPVTCDIC